MIVAQTADFPAGRTAVFDQLTHRSGKHLVIVRYTPAPERREEWVYNAADIDAAPLVWARDLGQPANRRLLDYFHDRTPWLLEPNIGDGVLIPHLFGRPAFRLWGGGL